MFVSNSNSTAGLQRDVVEEDPIVLGVLHFTGCIQGAEHYYHLFVGNIKQ